MKNINNMKILVLLIGAVTLIFSVSSKANDLFDQYAAGTAGSYRTTQQVNIYDGSWRANKNPIDLARLEPFSGSAGCGGIDIFGSSFTVISRDKIEQIRRTTVTSVPTYYFQISIRSVCKDCERLMSAIKYKMSGIKRFWKMTCDQADSLLNNKKIIDPGTFWYSSKH